MYYYASKLLWFVLEPTNAFVFLALIGLLLPGRARRAGRAMALFGVAGLIIAGMSPLATLMLRPLEEHFPAYSDTGEPVTGAIILGGALVPEITLARGQAALHEAAERLTAIAELSRRYPGLRVVFTGGAGELISSTSEATALESVMPTLAPGVKVEYERNSRNTVENAGMALALARPVPGERWLLVTSAFHMPRAIGIFRKVGWPGITPYPVDYRTAGTDVDWQPYLSISRGLSRFDLAAREWVGLLMTYATGKSTALFPAPAR